MSVMVEDTEFVILDLKQFAKSCATLGLELDMKAKTCHAFTDSSCDGVVRVAAPENAKRKPYEAMIRKVTHEGKTAYRLSVDDWNGGRGMTKIIGEDGNTLKNRYGADVVRRQLQREGLAVRETTGANGSIVLTALA